MTLHSDILPPNPYDRSMPRLILPAGITLLHEAEPGNERGARVTFNEDREFAVVYLSPDPENDDVIVSLYDRKTKINYIWDRTALGLPPC